MQPSVDRAVLNALGDAVVSADLSGRIEVWSAGATILFGWAEDEAVGRRIGELLRPVVAASRVDAIFDRITSKETFRGEFSVAHRAGQRLTVAAEVTGRFVDGELIGLVGIAWPLADWRAGTDLADSEERFARLVRAAQDGIVQTDAIGVIRYVDGAAADLLGGTPEELVGRSVLDVLPVDDHDVVRAEWAEILRDGTTVHRDRQVRRLDGTTIWAEVTSDLLIDGDGEMIGAIARVADVRERRQAFTALRDQEERFERMFRDSPIGMGIVDMSQRIQQTNPAMERMLGYGPGEMDGLTVADITHPDERGEALDYAAKVRGGEAAPMTRHKHFLHRDGHRVLCRVTNAIVRDDTGTPLYAIGLIEDLTDQEEAARTLLEQAQVYRRTIDAARDAFVGVDHDGCILEWNQAAEAMFGWPAPDAIGRPLVGTAVSPSDRVAADLGLVDGGGDGAATVPGRVAMTGLHRNGREFPIEASFIHLPEGGGEARLRAFIRDITDQVAYEKQLEDQALTDALTGLPNRALFVDRLREAVARLQRHTDGLAVLFLDVDSFKVVNDSLGHAAGDDLLVALAQRLLQHLRPGDTLARFGGDEFVVLCEEMKDATAAADLAQRLLNALDAPLRVGDRRHHCAVSIGIAVVDDPFAHPEEIIRNADTAMYRAKERGGDQGEIFDDAIRTRALARLNLENDLRSAVEQDEFEIHYQPVLTMDEQVVGAEALVRWRHPTRGLLAPAEFIPTAEKTRLIRPLGRHVLTRAVAQLAEWHQVGAEHLQLSVNLAGAQLDELDLPHRVDRLLRQHGLEPASLCLEITESMFMEDSAAVADGIQALRRLGVRLAVDDFGTGYSSMQYLRRFPVHSLKLDRVFVDGLDRNDADRAIVGSMIDLAHALGLTAVAEGVERPGQLAALRDLGCDLAQGFYWSPPVPAEVFGSALGSGVGAPAR